jgi:hypothetical protein
MSNLIVYHENPDEVHFYFVTDSCFNSIKTSFDKMTNDSSLEFLEDTAQLLNNTQNLTQDPIFMQTFCFQDVNMPSIKKLLVLPII